MTLDKITVSNVHDVAHICKTQDWDMLLALDGGERGGKSSLGADLVCKFSPHVEHDIQCGIYDTFLARYAWSWGDWYDLLKASQGQVVVREEADFLGRESLSDVNRRILRILTTVGRRNNEMILLFPDFWRLDLYARERTRVRGYVHARSIGPDGPTRGYVLWYVRQRYPFPRADGATVWWLKSGTGHFTHFSKNSPQHAEAWARFREIEEASKNRILDDSDTDPRRRICVKLHAKGMTIRDIADLVGLSKSRVGEFIKENPPEDGGV